jgi:hypothetical protein
VGLNTLEGRGCRPSLGAGPGLLDNANYERRYPRADQDVGEHPVPSPNSRIPGTAMAAGKPFIAHDCDATRGTSGGPFLVRQGGGWTVIGINIGATAGANLALPATAFAN